MAGMWPSIIRDGSSRWEDLSTRLQILWKALEIPSDRWRRWSRSMIPLWDFVREVSPWQEIPWIWYQAPWVSTVWENTVTRSIREYRNAVHCIRQMRPETGKQPVPTMWPVKRGWRKSGMSWRGKQRSKVRRQELSGSLRHPEEDPRTIRSSVKPSMVWVSVSRLLRMWVTRDDWRPWRWWKSTGKQIRPIRKM